MERINVQVRVAPLDCYSCGAETQMIASIGLSAGNEDIDCSITDFSDYPELARRGCASRQGQSGHCRDQAAL